MKRGDIVTVSAPGAYGKPRPAVVIQSDFLNQNDSVLVALVTSTLIDAPFFRLLLQPTEENGLRVPSQVMADKNSRHAPRKMRPRDWLARQRRNRRPQPPAFGDYRPRRLNP